MKRIILAVAALIFALVVIVGIGDAILNGVDISDTSEYEPDR